LKTDPAGGLLLIETSEVHRDRPWDATADHLKYLLEQLISVLTSSPSKKAEPKINKLSLMLPTSKYHPQPTEDP
jgi:hypothetical protein